MLVNGDLWQGCGGVSDARGTETGVVPQTVSANLEVTASGWEPKNVHHMHVRPFFACAMSFVMFLCLQACLLQNSVALSS